jgi:AcrR family transcriptional regulator
MVPTGPAHVSARAVLSAAEQHHGEQHDDDDGTDDHERLEPPGPGPVPGVGAAAGVDVGNGIEGRIVHWGLLGRGICPPYYFTIHYVEVKPECPARIMVYSGAMPKLWNQTIEAHRREVRDAILDTTAALAAEHGILAVTMSQIAEETGIGRATLYKYFPDVEAILVAWHERQITAHLAQLAEIRDQPGNAGQRVEAVLQAFAFLSSEPHGDHDPDLVGILHRGEHLHPAVHQLHALLRELLAEAAQAGDVRADVPADELATYCRHALTAARSLPSKAAVRRLVTVTLGGLHPPLT